MKLSMTTFMWSDLLAILVYSWYRPTELYLVFYLGQWYIGLYAAYHCTKMNSCGIFANILKYSSSSSLFILFISDVSGTRYNDKQLKEKIAQDLYIWVNVMCVLVCDGLIDGLLRGSVQVHCGDTSDPVRQAPQYVPRPSDPRADLGHLHPHLVTNRPRRQLHRAPVEVADTVHVLQRWLHHLLVDGFVLHAVRRDAVALLEDLSRHQRPRPSQSVPRHRAVLVRRRHRDPGAVAAVTQGSTPWPRGSRRRQPGDVE